MDKLDRIHQLHRLLASRHSPIAYDREQNSFTILKT
jgi:hypothetical protein